MNKYQMEFLLYLCKELGINTLRELEKAKNEEEAKTNNDLLQILAHKLVNKAVT